MCGVNQVHLIHHKVLTSLYHEEDKEERMAVNEMAR